MPMCKVLLFLDEDTQELIADALADEGLPEWVLELLEHMDTWKEPT